MGCCPSKPRGAAYASSDESADKTETVASVEGIPDVAEASGAAASTAGGANATSAASAPDAKRRASARVKQEANPEREVLGEEEEEKEGEKGDDAFDEDPRAHLIQAKTTERSDSGDRAQFQLEVSKFSTSGAESLKSPAPLALRSPARTPVNYEDMPISSTYHRVHSATIADKEAKRKEEERLEAEQREREVQEYKAAMMLQV